MIAPRPNAAIWGLLSAAVLVLDLYTKHLALQHLVPGVPVAFLEGFWNWTLAFNRGAAFSFLAGAGGWQRWLLSALAVGIIVFLSVCLWRLPRNDWRQALPFALIIGGALGNLIDRIRFGYVVDFIDWHWRGYHWPAFNVADAAIVSGAVGLVLFGLRRDGGRA